jgi:hypothetical protein
MQPLLGGGGAGLTPDADPRFERGQLTADLQNTMRCDAIRANLAVGLVSLPSRPRSTSQAAFAVPDIS